MSNIGKVINDFYCNGFFGRRYDITGAIIEGEGKDWIVIRIKNEVEGERDDLEIARFENKDYLNDMVNSWT